MEPELSHAARSRRPASADQRFDWIQHRIRADGRVEPDALVAAAFGVIPFAVGLGFFLDSSLIRRDLRA